MLQYLLFIIKDLNMLINGFQSRHSRGILFLFLFILSLNPVFMNRKIDTYAKKVLKDTRNKNIYLNF